MDRKLLINLCVLAALVCLTLIAGLSAEAPEIDPDRMEIMSEREIEEFKEDGLKSDRMFKMLPLGFLTVIYAGVLFVIYLLPNIVHRATHTLYDSSEELEQDPLHDARALFAQGDYEGSIEAYRGVAEEQAGNRFPWVEIAKIQSMNLEDPDAAIATLKAALESYEWEVKDAAFMMFRLAELYEKEKQDVEMTKDILQQVVQMFPETRHSANATHRLRELGAL